LGDTRAWAALEIKSEDPAQDDLVVAILDDFSPAAIEDLVLLPLPPGGLWDPTYPPLPDAAPGPIHWRAFFATTAARDAAAAALHERWPNLNLDLAEVADEDWAARSQRALGAIRAGAFVIAPPWDLPAKVEPATIVIVIEPSRGFGTGHHASTRQCLRALSDIDVNGRRVLDLGTGSGVLAMACAIKGGRTVVAIDIDADAIEAAQESAALNTLPSVIEWVVGDFRASDSMGVVPGAYDLVTANLTGGMLIASAARIQELVAPGGLVVMSGFDEDERSHVRAAFAALQQRACFSEDGWVGLMLEKPVGGGRLTVGGRRSTVDGRRSTVDSSS
jgi:ribosomal protein L11 methyltransferase